MAHHRLGRAPGQRFRFEQYIPYLKSEGYQIDLAPLLDEKQDQILYAQGNILPKARLAIETLARRLRDVQRAKKYDLVYLYREAYLVGGAFIEKMIARTGVPFLVDYDDAVWLPNISAGNKRWAFLKNTAKAHTIFRYATGLVAGNNYLADYGRQFNPNVFMIPTTVDTDLYCPQPLPQKQEPIIIGWSGSPTTVPHFETLIPVLKQLKDRYGNRISFRLIGDGQYKNAELGIEGISWSVERELETINSFDIGIMPLPNDAWSKGKCGLKGLSYMAFEKATVMSAVGVNREIITDGVNGFLAENESDWLAKLSMLIEDEALRKKLGKEGRQTVINGYSVEANKAKYLEAIGWTIAQKNARG
jgi:glycosyltransferase involved in cell wall biosynthesis